MNVRVKNVSSLIAFLKDGATGEECRVPAHSEALVEERFTKMLPSYVHNMDKKEEVKITRSPAIKTSIATASKPKITDTNFSEGEKAVTDIAPGN